MRLNITCLFFALVLLLTLPGQTVRAAESAAPPPVAAPAAQTTAAPAAGPAWMVRCEEPKPDKPSHCEMFQRLSIIQKDDKGNNANTQRVAEFAMGFVPGQKKKMQGVMILPLGLLVAEPVIVEVDDKKKLKFDVRYCQAEGCVALFAVPDSVLKAMAKGQKLTIKAKAATGQNFHIAMPLNGFSAAWGKVKDVP